MRTALKIVLKGKYPFTIKADEVYSIAPVWIESTTGYGFVGALSINEAQGTPLILSGKFGSPEDLTRALQCGFTVCPPYGRGARIISALICEGRARVLEGHEVLPEYLDAPVLSDQCLGTDVLEAVGHGQKHPRA